MSAVPEHDSARKGGAFCILMRLEVKTKRRGYVQLPLDSDCLRNAFKC